MPDLHRARVTLSDLAASQSGNPLIQVAYLEIEALVDDVERLAGEAAAWQALAVEATSIGPVMKGIGMVRCAFCSSVAPPDYLPKHKDGCLVLRVRQARAGT